MGCKCNEQREKTYKLLRLAVGVLCVDIAVRTLAVMYLLTI